MDEKIKILKDNIEKKFSFAQVKIAPFDSEEDKSIKYFIWILYVPNDQLCAVEDYAMDNAISLYDNEPLPFCISAVSPKNTSKYFDQDDIIHTSDILFAPINIPLVNLGIYGGNAVLSQGWAEVASGGWVPLDNISIPVDAQPVIDKLGTYGLTAMTSQGWAAVVSHGWVPLDNNSIFINAQPQNEDITEETSFATEEKLSLAA